MLCVTRGTRKSEAAPWPEEATCCVRDAGHFSLLGAGEMASLRYLRGLVFGACARAATWPPTSGAPRAPPPLS